jgi:hypothetical protein
MSEEFVICNLFSDKIKQLKFLKASEINIHVYYIIINVVYFMTAHVELKLIRVRTLFKRIVLYG